MIGPHGERKERIRDIQYYKTRGLTDIVRSGNYGHFDLEFPVVQEDGLQDVMNGQIHSAIIEFRTRRLIASLSHFGLEDIPQDPAILIGPPGRMIGTLDLKISPDVLRLSQHGVELICISMSAPVCEKHAYLRNTGTKYLEEGCFYTECFFDINRSSYEVYESASKWQFRCYDVL